MPQRLKLIIAYDGSHFAGWQSQKHGNTVQDHLERAFRQVCGEPLRIHGAGRTDAGVHALAQCAHVDVPDTRLPVTRWAAALNAGLPPQLRVIKCARVKSDFHARFSAVGKVYRYRMWSGPILPPLEHNRAWHVLRALDPDLLRAAALKFRGKHDFAGFAANRGQEVRDTVRTIRSVKVRRRGFLWTLEFEGDGFLYKMVRLMVGAITDVASGKIHLEKIVDRFERKANSSARFAAPACGLYLVRVRY